MFDALGGVGDPASLTNNFETYLVVNSNNVNPNEDLRASYNDMENYANLSNYQFISDNYTTILGLNAYQVLYTWTDEYGTQKETGDVLIRKNSTVYVIEYESEIQDFEKNQPNFNLILNSFNITS